MNVLIMMLLGGLGSLLYAVLGFLDGKVRNNETWQPWLMLRALAWGLIAGWTYASVTGYPEELSMTVITGAIGSGMLGDAVGRKGLILFLTQLQEKFKTFFAQQE